MRTKAGIAGSPCSSVISKEHTIQSRIISLRPRVIRSVDNPCMRTFADLDAVDRKRGMPSSQASHFANDNLSPVAAVDSDEATFSGGVADAVNRPDRAR
jgi:hypothetical protein